MESNLRRTALDRAVEEFLRETKDVKLDLKYSRLVRTIYIEFPYHKATKQFYSYATKAQIKAWLKREVRRYKEISNEVDKARYNKEQGKLL